MSSDAVDVRSPAGSNKDTFAQNGQIDWVAFGNSIWSNSSIVLQRFASAGVQPITFGAGLVLASGFELDRIGKQRMHSALEKLRGIWGFEKLLWFGFGARSLLHVMADAQQGVNCIALCSALSAVHDEHAAAWILDELWKTYGYPQQFLQSHSQFAALVKACSGVLTGTEFSLFPDRVLGHTLDPQTFKHEMADLEDTAKAMRGIFRITKGEIARITVFGGMECAFVASFAHWVLNLKVYVNDEAGMVTYQDASFEEAQVVVTYCRQAELSLVQVSSTTYILRNNEEISRRMPTLDQTLLIVRTPWDSCLTRVFGSTFSSLIKAPMIFGALFGSIARVHHALAVGENDVGDFQRQTYINFVESSYGIGFINSVVSTFPELKQVTGLFDEMQLALDVPLRESFRTIEGTILKLEGICQCRRCNPGEKERKIRCIVVLALSIREMVSTISCVKVASEILPTVRGMDCIYNRLEAEWRNPTKKKKRPLLADVLDLSLQDVFGTDYERLRCFDLLSHPVEIFSGYSYHGRYLPENNPGGNEFCTATVKQGLCYYMNCLQSLSSHPENARVVHIIPGHIQVDDRQFSSVYDGPVMSEVHPSPIQVHPLEQADPACMIRPASGPNVKLEIFCLEKAVEHELVVFYRALVPGEPAITLGPGRISREVLKRTGLVTCAGSHCTFRLLVPCALIQQGWQVSEKGIAKIWTGSQTGQKCLVWPQLDDPARCVAIQKCLANTANPLFLRRDECMSCCTISVVRELRDRRDIVHIV